jgi:quercetin dioxygenase-like cupin family protein
MTSNLAYLDELRPGGAKTSAQALLEKSIWFMGSLMTVHLDSAASGGGSALIEMVGGPGVEPPFHVHQKEDEMFYVIEGAMTVFRGKEEITLKPGESGFLPRGIPHTFKILSPTARWLVYMTPGGFEEFFRAVGRPAQALTLEANPAPPDFGRMIALGESLGLRFFPELTNGILN